MSNKGNSSVVKLIGNKVFILLMIFALAIIMISAAFNRNEEKVSQNQEIIQEEFEEDVPVISEKDEQEIYEPEITEEVETVVATENEPVEEVTEVRYKIPLTGELQKNFSIDELLWDETMQDWRTHNGIDIAADTGAEVDTAAPGTVIEAYNDETYGYTVKVKHADGVVTVYKNLEKTVVKKDDILDEGQMIGTVGNTGAFEIAQKPHLHFEVIFEDKNINPLEFIK